MSEVKVTDLVSDIRANLKQKGCNQKDEVKVMQAMLNDKTYSVGVYDKNGKIDDYCPSKDARNMITSVMVETVKLSKDEASVLAEDHVFSKQEATSMVNVSKEYINTYLQTGRKICLGGRENSCTSLIANNEGASSKRYPSKTVDANGNVSYQTVSVPVPPYTKVKSISPCPTWVQ